MNIIPGNEDTFSKYYLDLSKNTTKNGTQKHEHLQDAYRKAAGIKLSFPFPFYGHRLYNGDVFKS
jgi:hypothetical protein